MYNISRHPLPTSLPFHVPLCMALTIFVHHLSLAGNVKYCNICRFVSVCMQYATIHSVSSSLKLFTEKKKELYPDNFTKNVYILQEKAKKRKRSRKSSPVFAVFILL
jgi:hypothetical protein